jgi:hypothetical protein
LTSRTIAACSDSARWSRFRRTPSYSTLKGDAYPHTKGDT